MARPVVRSAVLLIVAATMVVLAAGPAASGANANPDQTDLWAWVVDRSPSSNLSLAPGKDSGNSAGATNTVTHEATGLYRVGLPGVQAAIGNVLVSALGTSPRTCVPDDWASIPGVAGVHPPEEIVDIGCYTLDGTPADATFVVNWIAASGQGGVLAYGLNFEPTTSCETPQDLYNSSGDSIQTCLANSSIARWEILTLGSAHGTVQVTPFGHRANDSDSNPSGGICDIVRFVPQIDLNTSDMDEYVDVKCYDLNGQPGGSDQIYREHMVWYMRNLGMKGADNSSVAYVFASKPAASSYTAPSAYSYNSAGGTNRVTRSGVGVYKVTLAGMPRGGSAEVSAYLGDPSIAPHACVIASISKSTTPEKIGVRCFDLAGNPADAKFTLSYAR